MKHEFSKDDKNVYYNEEIIKGADIKTHQIIKYDYSKDKNNVYSGEYKIKDANPQTFEVLSECYSKDNKTVFYGTSKVNVNIDNFKIQNHHIQDNEKAFCGSQEIKAVDIKTFEIIGMFISKDKNYVWDEEDVISRADPKIFKIIKI